MAEQVMAARRSGSAAGEATAEAPGTLRDLFEAHAAFVCRSLRRLGVLEADLDDMLQEVFVVVHRRLPDYREEGRARSWLYSICTRVVQAQRRHRSRRPESLVPEPPEENVSASQQAWVESRQALELGRELLSLLPAAQREVFVLYEVEDMAMPEVAAALGCPLQTAYSRLYAARRRVVAELSVRRRGEDDEG